MATSTYAIAIGSNRPGRHGGPVAEVRAAVAALDGVRAVAPIMASAPIGPSLRRYANTVLLLDTSLSPPDMLAQLKGIERSFGRRRGRRWGSRVIDLDIVLWSGGRWHSRGLCVPHIAFRERLFVLRPLRDVAPDWRDPVSGRTIRQLHQLVDRARPRD
ncbi:MULTISPECIES: 2-amino-4-hydroxy-6-hydroxymethyldihydropteridine diphosphokinase [Sphingomonas]|uniref:2-amino-4-hydroxy-6-hydroxymethyldihydropteridine pyrophosphokinase n=1 Tax=Sphingomonas hankookensis TaxID=563996 RepID=A0ABR5YFR5_9SPHN|nr:MULTISPECIES: 2-amino-4-hydroxy-6-hydroxymethyldihydropteridine diphosphokinase [Sphingomonas]KZE18534.1 7,8-dihydro-6-hydroxymethylpterin-pyrophosphokinase [Sphingomonas hankookensis]RSV32741.1 2-amino-4-hydroxy-6-hydroxymethyldihydropteridine diphosphokinase [Sphingomonas sp. ABOLH]WCP73443.1 2-amino-4-hydroxy-6-hydroxymethyldihydropteridine diphosphokinase [Sphingomonas hankookensis]